MEDQRAEEAWFENEWRSGRNPSKGCGCPIDMDTAIPPFRPSCFQPVPKKELSDAIFEAAANQFGITGEQEKSDLKLMFDTYSQFKLRESVIKAFSDPAKEANQK